MVSQTRSNERREPLENNMKDEIIILDKGLYDANPIVCGHQICEPSYWYQSVRGYYLFHYILSGKGTFENQGRMYRLGEGDLFIIRPGESTKYQADAEDPWHYVWVGFSSVQDLSRAVEQDVLHVPELRYVFEDLIRARELTENCEYYISAKVLEILCQIDRRHPGEQNAPVYVKKAASYIRANYMKEITVAELSAMLNLERSYFSAIFKKEMGVSPQTFLIDCRLNKAAELLTLYHYKVEEAAYACGYTDPASFSKMFKKKFGVSPRKYTSIK